MITGIGIPINQSRPPVNITYTSLYRAEFELRDLQTVPLWLSAVVQVPYETALGGTQRNEARPIDVKAHERDPSGFHPTRRIALALIAGVAATPAFAVDAFAGFLESLWPNAKAVGVRRETFESAIAGLTPDPSVPRSSGGQPEFEKPLQAYYAQAVSAGRLAKGRALAAQYQAELAAIEQRFGVPGEICLAAWGMESDFGRARGGHDIVRTLATLAYVRPDRPVFRDEFAAALLIIDHGQVARQNLVGSWAGAMGDPQFLPSAYLKYAVSAGGGDAAPDIWTNAPDILASIASFMHGSGWAGSQPWIEDVVLPQGFAYPTLHASAAEWASLGLRRGDGREPAGDGSAALFLPSGAAGPAFLLFANYFVIKQYNNSDSYALSLGSMAQRIAGGAAPTVAWPAKPINLSRKDKAFIQTRLAALGLYEGSQDGKLGPKARDAIHAYQLKAGLQPADGFATPAVVASLKGAK